MQYQREREGVGDNGRKIKGEAREEKGMKTE